MVGLRPLAFYSARWIYALKHALGTAGAPQPGPQGTAKSMRMSRLRPRGMHGQREWQGACFQPMVRPMVRTHAQRARTPHLCEADRAGAASASSTCSADVMLTLVKSAPERTDTVRTSAGRPRALLPAAAIAALRSVALSARRPPPLEPVHGCVSYKKQAAVARALCLWHACAHTTAWLGNAKCRE